MSLWNIKGIVIVGYGFYPQSFKSSN